MSYRFNEGESVEAAVRRVACEQLARAIEELTDGALDRHETIHQVRKRCKKLRGLLRLVRPALGEMYAFENARFRDAARDLSDVRDATALLETYDALMARFARQVDRRAFAPIRRTLTLRRRDVVNGEVDVDERLARFLTEMQQARTRASMWDVSAEGFGAVRGGLEKTYRRGRNGMVAAYEDPSDENFHEWRKRVKYHWYHTRLLQPVWKPVLQKRREALRRLSILLGDDHDLAVFRGAVLDDPDAFSNIRSLQAFFGLLDRTRTDLQAKAHPLGRRLFADKPGALGTRFESYWQAWQAEAAARPLLAAPQSRAKSVEAGGGGGALLS